LGTKKFRITSRAHIIPVAAKRVSRKELRAAF
jgi:hypothetical protein